MQSRASTNGWERKPFEMKVLASRQITPSTRSIMLEKPDGFSFRATQFTFLTLETDEGPDSRPMSIATSPTRPNLEYAVRTGESAFKRAFASLRPGDSVVVQGPFGHFLLREDRPAVLLAGGIGITPLKGMAEYATDKFLAIPMRLVYSNRIEEEIAYRSELEELERRNPNFRVLHTLTGRKVPKGWKGSAGRIDAHMISGATKDLHEPVYYICGTPSMVGAMLDLLSYSGVPEADIVEEVFRGYRG
jgi:ferredoxin-NADP reductase